MLIWIFISLCFNRTTFILFELVGRCDYLCYFSVGFYSSTQVDKIKYRHGMDNYDRIVAFMNGQDQTKFRRVKHVISLRASYHLSL